MTKAHTPTEMSKGQSDNTNNATKKFDYTAVADRASLTNNVTSFARAKSASCPSPLVESSPVPVRVGVCARTTTLTLVITFKPKETGLSYFRWSFLVTSPFTWYDNCWPCDLELWPTFEKKTVTLAAIRRASLFSANSYWKSWLDKPGWLWS